MVKKITTLMFATGLAVGVNAQLKFPVNIDTSWSVKTVWMPKSPLKYQTIFVGGVDEVMTTATTVKVPLKGEIKSPAGKELAKQWHDYIAVVKDNAKPSEGWVIVNHEMIQANDKIGDGGGMTMFKLKKNSDGTLEQVEQTLADGRKGKFFNVDFANTVGETGMNCGGINANGRVWTAEEWMQTSNAAISSKGTGFRDTSDFVIGQTTPAGFPGFDGKTLKRYQNLNWMVEIDPKNAKAVRKQYNWGRAGWEGGVVMADNKTVYLFEDGSPGILGKFEASSAGDFTKGQMYVYKHDAPTKWISIENNLDTLVNLNTVAVRRGATMFNRLEWGQIFNGKVYICETGRDAFDYKKFNGVVSPSLVDGYKTRYKIEKGVDFPGTNAAAADSVKNGKFADYYGRVIEFDPATNSVRSFIEGGPFTSAKTSEQYASYPKIHMSNPDGVDFMKVGNKNYMIIQEDLNGLTYNRMPGAMTKTVCETYLLDMSIQNPTYNDLIRLTACAPGAEITGATMFDDATMLLNSQHPDAGNTYPYNNSLTYAISGFEALSTLSLPTLNAQNEFTVYPNPTSREIFFNKRTDVAIYNVSGERVRVYRDVEQVNVEELGAGTYFVQNAEGNTLKVIIE